MPNSGRPRVAIVDYGMGNLFSVKHACEHVHMDAVITASKDEILNASAVVLPGVGAFGDAMATLRKQDLVSVLHDVVASGKPFVGICLGMQLLMTESHEFGSHRGLGFVEGEVLRLDDNLAGERHLKVPHVGWNRIYRQGVETDKTVAQWADSMMEPVANGSFMYFVHSYYTLPADQNIILSHTRFGALEFCSSFRKGSIFACQFHPERSGPAGLKIYEKLVAAANLVECND